MADRTQLARGRDLLELARKETKPLDQRLLVAAAFSSVMETPPIVVGGTAQEHWAGGPYRPTDLDLIPSPSRTDMAAFRQLGFTKRGRHWIWGDMGVGVEFPHDESFEVRRTFDKKIKGAIVKLIGVDDLYLDRLSQSTATMNVRDESFTSVVAIALSNWSVLDWGYIDARIREIGLTNRPVGEAMKAMQRRCRREVRNALARRRASEL